MSNQPDVAVVGAGIVGLSIALHLAKHGVDVTVIEQSGIAAGQSGVQPGGVRQQWSTRINCAMARESVAFYANLHDRIETSLDPNFARCGYLFVAESTESLSELRTGVRLQNECGIPSRIVSPGEVEELVPGIATDHVHGAAWCGEDGYFDRPQSVVEAFAEAAQLSGASVRIDEVTALLPTRSLWRLDLRRGDAIIASQVVLAAGYDSPDLVKPLGIELPIVREARYLFMSDPIRERILEPLVIASERRLAAKQLANGRVLASDLGARGDPGAHAGDWRRHIHESSRLLPILEFVTLPLLVEGFYDVTPDHNAILGQLDKGLWVAAGFSGHGFMMAPATGRVLAAAIAGEDRHPWLDELSPERFTRGAPEAEARIV